MRENLPFWWHFLVHSEVFFYFNHFYSYLLRFQNNNKSNLNGWKLIFRLELNVLFCSRRNINSRDWKILLSPLELTTLEFELVHMHHYEWSDLVTAKECQKPFRVINRNCLVGSPVELDVLKLYLSFFCIIFYHTLLVKSHLPFVSGCSLWLCEIISDHTHFMVVYVYLLLSSDQVCTNIRMSKDTCMCALVRSLTQMRIVNGRVLSMKHNNSSISYQQIVNLSVVQ